MSNNILVLAPHTDDGELGCGGTIAKYIENGDTVFYVAFSSCQDSIPEGYPKDVLEHELKNAMDVLGVKRENSRILDYPVRRFGEFRQNILDDMIKLERELHPKCVLSTSPRDIHQDHYVIAKEAMRAFKKTTLFAYEVPWNNFEFHNQAFVTLEKRHIEKKVRAIACYDTQKNRPYTASDFTFGQARLHGAQIGREYAEVYEVIRWVE